MDIQKIEFHAWDDIQKNIQKIEFRAWDKANKIMFYNIQNGITFEDGSHCRFDEFLSRGRWIVMQYTGMKDKNGKKIFEGDVMKLMYKDKAHIAEVKYFDELGSFLVEGKGIRLSLFSEDEIIGNIY